MVFLSVPIIFLCDLHVVATAQPAGEVISEQYKAEIMKLKLEIEALRTQNSHLQQKLLISLSNHHSSLPHQPPSAEASERTSPSSLQPPSPSPAQAYPPDGFLEEGSNSSSPSFRLFLSQNCRNGSIVEQHPNQNPPWYLSEHSPEDPLHY